MTLRVTPFLFVALAACASKQPARCEPVPTEIALIAGTEVFRECAVERKAELVTQIIMDYRPSANQRCGNAEIEFVIDSTGKPLPATVRDVKTNDRALSKAFSEAVLSQKFTPATIGGRPVASLTTMGKGYEVAKVEFVVPGQRTPPRSSC